MLGPDDLLADRQSTLSKRDRFGVLALAIEFSDGGFREYAAFASPKPLRVADLQTQLRDDEALLFFLDPREAKPTTEET